MNDNHILYTAVLKKYWGYDSFRPLQEEIIDSVYRGKDTLALMPTGGGKSITFQVPALAKSGICIVVTPLIALMKDQVDNLRSKNVLATAVYSGMSNEKIKTELENCVFGDYKFLYVSPERLETDLFIRCVRQMNVNLIAVDEAHCISQWGYDFRPSYLKIAELRKYVSAPVLALTATAKEDVVDDIQLQLQFSEKNVLKKSFERKNLRYLVRKTDDKLAYCFRILNNTNGTAIVYVRSRKKTKEISDILSNEGISAEGYNAGLSPEEKEARQNRWKTGETRVMVATNAFGMGIDKADVRVVVHLDLPESVEAYFQEAGRAGRDVKESFAVLLYNSKDEATVKRHLTMSFPEEEYIKKVYSKICYQYEIGVGEGEGMSFQFDILDFCRRYKLSIEMVESSLEILKLENYISITEPESLRSRLMFTMSRDELYRNSFTDRDDLQEVLEYLMRNFTGIFTNYAYINEESIARSLCMSKRDLCGKLIALSHEGVITYIPAGKLPIITFIAPREDERRLYISKASYGDRLERATYRAMSMIEYASQTDTCRSKWLLGFFGEDNACDCGMCDVCMNAKNGASPSRKALADAILKALEAGELSINDIAQIGEEGAKANMLELRRLVESGKVVEIEGRDGFFKLAK